LLLHRLLRRCPAPQRRRVKRRPDLGGGRRSGGAQTGRIGAAGGDVADLDEGADGAERVRASARDRDVPAMDARERSDHPPGVLEVETHRLGQPIGAEERAQQPTDLALHIIADDAFERVVQRALLLRDEPQGLAAEPPPVFEAEIVDDGRAPSGVLHRVRHGELLPAPTWIERASSAAAA
jgi:hypothetical protein